MNIKEMQFGDAVRFVRMKLGLSQTELANGKPLGKRGA